MSAAAFLVVAALVATSTEAKLTGNEDTIIARLQNDNARLRGQLEAIDSLSRERKNMLRGWLASRSGVCKTKSEAWEGDCEPRRTLGATGGPSPPSSQEPYAPSAAAAVPRNSTRNGAKCAGENQSQNIVEGTLDCATLVNAPAGGVQLPHTGANCPDNLSSGKAFVRRQEGTGWCDDFNSDNAFGKLTISVAPAGIARLLGNNPENVTSLITKMGVAHPNNAERGIGVMFLKRLKCVTRAGAETCEVFKTSVCVSCPVDVFDEEKQTAAETPVQLARFVDCCVKGQPRFFSPDVLSEAVCPTGSGDGAFTNPGQANAALKPSYVCTDSDKSRADDFLKGL